LLATLRSRQARQPSWLRRVRLRETEFRGGSSQTEFGNEETGSRPTVKRREDTMQPNRSRSRVAFERACKAIPGGVNSPARAFGGVGGQPIFITRGAGPFL